MQLIDVGVNLMSPAFAHDREAVVSAARNAGVFPLVITGSSMASSAAAVKFAAGCGCYATVGVHPHNAKDWNAETASRIRELALKKRIAANSGAAISGACCAVGECGLDYNRNFSPPSAQRECFEAQLSLAEELGKPVFLHERDAFADFFAILKNYRFKGAVVHCFTGTADELEAYLEIGCHIGITGWICDERRGSHLLDLVKRIPADRLLLETDAPYLLPRNLPAQAASSGTAKGRSGRNEPRFLPHIAACIAQALEKPVEQLAAETSANATKFFGLETQE